MNKRMFNRFLLLKLPIARIAGVRLRNMDDISCAMEVRYGWRNQNPFNSMFWAVEGMAAELSTGALCISKVQASGRRVSMLVVNLEAGFFKKAVGLIRFTCNQGAEVDAALQRAFETMEPQVVKLRSVGVDEQNDRVAEFVFTWSFKAKA